jgi:hypothetical protein
MAFAEYKAKEPGPSTKAITPTEVKVAVSGKKNLSLSIVIGYELLKSCGMIIGDRVALYFGTDDDKGKVLIKKIERGGTAVLAYASRKSKEGEQLPPHGQVFRKIEPVAPIEDFTNKQILSEKVESQWDKDAAGLMVTLPKAFFP